MDNQYRTMSRAPSMDMSLDQGLRTFMLGIYRHMMIAIAITGVIALMTSQSQDLMRVIFTTPLRWVVMFGPLAFVFFLAARVYKMSPGAARVAFYAFAAMMGLSVATIFIRFEPMLIAQVFFMTSAMFGGLSLWGYTTKKDISGWGSFLIMGVIGIIIASVANLFLGSSAVYFAINLIGLGIFAGLTSYDTQRLKHSYYQIGADASMAARVSIMGALSLYINFLNMFMMLLSLLGGNRN